MKILLDECVTKKLKNHLTEFEVFTISEMGWSGVKNGKLMTLCVENNFDVLLTIDKNLMFQQNLDRYNVTIAVFNCKTSKIEDILNFLESFKKQLFDFKKNKAYLIDL
jgi:predicted nuclease of predicted toxin-antitoxin system